jgi:hypothetical protein
MSARMLFRGRHHVIVNMDAEMTRLSVKRLGFDATGMPGREVFTTPVLAALQRTMDDTYRDRARRTLAFVNSDGVAGTMFIEPYRFQDGEPGLIATWLPVPAPVPQPDSPGRVPALQEQ